MSVAAVIIPRRSPRRPITYYRKRLSRMYCSHHVHLFLFLVLVLIPAPRSRLPQSLPFAHPRTPHRRKLRLFPHLVPPRPSRDGVAENCAKTVHHPDLVSAEARDEDAAVVLAAAPLGHKTRGSVLPYVSLGEDGDARGAEGMWCVEFGGGAAAQEGDAGVAFCEAIGSGDELVATSVIDCVGGNAHLARSVVLNV